MTNTQKTGRRGEVPSSLRHLGFWRWDFLGYLGLEHWAFCSIAVWFVFGGVFSSTAQAQPGTQLWSYTAPGGAASCPALAPDGIIYIGTGYGLCAITNAGSNKWTFPVGQSSAYSPAIGSDGTVYYGGKDANFYAVKPDGTQRWMFALQPEYQSKVTYDSSPSIAADGAVYFIASGRLYAFTADGVKKWEYVVDDQSTPNQALSPAIGLDGTIYAGSYYNHTFYALAPDGTVKWQFVTYQACGDSAAIGLDGTIYFTGAYLYAFSPAGTETWECHADGFSGASPVVATDGSLYVTTPKTLYSISKGGQANWSATCGLDYFGAPTTTPAIDAGGNVYFCSSNSVFAFDSGDNLQWKFVSPFSGITPVSMAPPTVCSPAIGPDGTIYAAFGNILYALKGSSNSLASSPWPMYRQNLRHTGKVEKPSLAPPKKRADANFDIQLAGEIGQAYSVQSTSNFFNWTSVTSFVATSLPMSVADLTATNAPSRFYRATTP